MTEPQKQNYRVSICDHCRSLLADPTLHATAIHLRHVACHAKLTQALRILATHFDATMDVRGDAEHEVGGGTLELTEWAKQQEEFWRKSAHR